MRHCKICGRPRAGHGEYKLMCCGEEDGKPLFVCSLCDPERWNTWLDRKRAKAAKKAESRQKQTAGAPKPAQNPQPQFKKPAPKVFEGDGIKVIVQDTSNRHARLSFESKKPLSKYAQCQILADLKLACARERTHPVVKSLHGECPHLKRDAARRVAKRIVARLRRDKGYAEIKEMRVPKNWWNPPPPSGWKQPAGVVGAAATPMTNQQREGLKAGGHPASSVCRSQEKPV